MKYAVKITSFLLCVVFLFSACKKSAGSPENSSSKTDVPSGAVSVSAEPPAAPSSSKPQRALEYDEEMTVELINGVLSRYKSGEFPREFFYYGDIHYEHIPAEISLPETIEFADLIDYESEYVGLQDRWGSEYHVETVLVLDKGYGMKFWLSVPPLGEDIESYLGPDVFRNKMVDLKEEIEIESLTTASGIRLHDIEIDRVRITAEYSNLQTSQGETSSGTLTWERINQRFILDAPLSDRLGAFGVIALLLNGQDVLSMDFPSEMELDIENGQQEGEYLLNEAEKVFKEFVDVLSSGGYI